MSREDPQLKVRLPQELKDKITESASNLGRSINADVVARLQSTFDEDEQLEKSPIGLFISEYEKSMKEASSSMENLSKVVLNQSNTIKIQANVIEDQKLLIYKLLNSIETEFSINEIEEEAKKLTEQLLNIKNSKK